MRDSKTIKSTSQESFNPSNFKIGYEERYEMKCPMLW